MYSIVARYLTALAVVAAITLCAQPADSGNRLSPQGGSVVSVGAATGGGLVATGTPTAPFLGLLTSCSTGQTLTWGGSAWACGAGGITNAAGNNVIPKSNGTNLIASSVTDDGTTVLTTENLRSNGNVTVDGTLHPVGLSTLTGGFTLGADSSANSHKITSVTDPTSAQDAATKNYVDTAGNPGYLGPFSLGTSQNDYSPTGFGTKRVVLITPTANINITGFAAQADGYTFALLNNDTAGFSLTLKHENASSIATNRLSLPDQLDGWQMYAGCSASFRYSTSAGLNRWQVLAWSCDSLPRVTTSNIFATSVLGTTSINGSVTVGSGNSVLIGSTTTFNGTAPVTFQGNLTSNAGSITTLGQVRFGTISPTLTGGASVNDYAPSGLADATTIFANCPSGTCTITGLAGGADGRKVTVYNTGAGEIDLPHNNAGSSAANRWNDSNLGGVIQLLANTGCSADFTYSTTDNFWHETGFTCYPWTDSSVTLATNRSISTGANVSATGFADAAGGVYAGGTGLADAMYMGAIDSTHPDLSCAYNNNAAFTCYLGGVGYSGGTTQPRSWEIDDGQGTGSTHRMAFFDAVNSGITLGRSASDSITFSNGPKGINGEQGKHFEWTEEWLWGATTSNQVGQGPMALDIVSSGTGTGFAPYAVTDQASGRDDRMGEVALKTGTATSGSYSNITSGKALTTQNSKTLTLESTVKWDVLSSSSNSVASMYATIWGFTDTANAGPVKDVVNGCYFAYDKGNALAGNKNAGNVDALECWCASASTRTGYLINNTGNSDNSFPLGVGTIAAQTYYGTKIVWNSTIAKFFRRTASGAYTEVCEINTNMPGVAVGIEYGQFPLAATGTGDREFILDQTTLAVDLNAIKNP